MCVLGLPKPHYTLLHMKNPPRFCRYCSQRGDFKCLSGDVLLARRGQPTDVREAVLDWDSEPILMGQDLLSQ